MTEDIFDDGTSMFDSQGMTGNRGTREVYPNNDSEDETEGSMYETSESASTESEEEYKRRRRKQRRRKPTTIVKIEGQSHRTSPKRRREETHYPAQWDANQHAGLNNNTNYPQPNLNFNNGS